MLTLIPQPVIFCHIRISTLKRRIMETDIDARDTNPSGQTIYFDNRKHRYFTDDNENLLSVTRMVSDNFPVFKADEIAEKYALKHNRSKNDVLKEWTDKAEKSRSWGNKLHFFAECACLGKQTPQPKNAKEKAFYNVIEETVEIINIEYDIIGVEKIVFSPKYNIAGTVDLLLKSKRSPDCITIADWKSNQEIRTSNPYQYGLGELEHLDHCNFNHYSLQLGIYEWILRNEYYVAEHIKIFKKIIHITLPHCIWMPCREMTEEVDYVIKQNT